MEDKEVEISSICFCPSVFSLLLCGIFSGINKHIMHDPVCKKISIILLIL